MRGGDRARGPGAAHDHLILAFSPDQGFALDPLDLGRNSLASYPLNHPLARALARALADHQAGRLNEAAAGYRTVLAAVPDHPDALHLLGLVHCHSGGFATGLPLLRRAVTAAPNNLDFRHDLALALRQSGALADAAHAYAAVLKHQPDNLRALTGLFAALTELGRNDQALTCLRTTIATHPDHAPAQVNLGNLLLERGRTEEAIAAYRRALALQPELIPAWINLGYTLRDQDRLNEAVTCLETALDLGLDDGGLVLGELVHLALRACDWGRLERLEPALLATVRHHPRCAVNPFLTLLLPGATAADQRHAARTCAAGIAAQTKPSLPPPHPTLAPPTPAPPTLAEHKRKLRLCYLSADFHRHPTADLTAEVFELHDRSRFEVIAGSLGPNDDSAMRRRLEAGFDRFLDLSALSDDEATTCLRAEHLDILVDLKGYTTNCRPGILARRPAPVQVNWLGYPGTMGAPFIDYLIGDPVVTPAECRDAFDETLVLLPDCYQPNDRRREIAPVTPPREALGLPETGFVFCVFNNAVKFTRPLFRLWLEVVRTVPGAVLWLLDPGPTATANLRREAVDAGVDPGRMVFRPRMAPADYRACFRAADLFLDSAPYNAHTTASDALWAGLPVVTRPGETMASRVAASLLHAVRLPELICPDWIAYRALALELARDPAQLAALRHHLVSNRNHLPLFDSPRFVTHLEQAYQAMCRGR
ncbi:protein O-GlcNAc transferase [uncultured Gammaproteobacteria bacterium]